jgi:hypothetical protein
VLVRKSAAVSPAELSAHPTRKLAVLAAAAVVTCLLLALAPGAQAAFKPYAVVLSTPTTFPSVPATVPAGATSSILATYTNLTSQQQLGSSDLTAPSGLTVTGAAVPAPATASVSSNVVRIRNLSLAPGRSVTVTLTVTTPPSCTTSGLVWPTPVTKQSNDFNGPPGNNLDFVASSSDLRTTVTGTTCILRFAQQPADAGTDMAITSAPFDTTGTPIGVEIVDGSGTRITNSSAPVTIGVAANPASGTLAGTVTVNATAGLARFSTLSLNRAGSGYTLAASSPSMTSATSSPFTIEDPTYGVVATNADDTRPATLPAGDELQRKLVITTLTGGRTLRSANITVPAGVAVTGAAVPGPGTATISGSIVQLRGLSVARHASTTVTLTLRAPCTASALAWSSVAKSTPDFSGPADIVLDDAATELPTTLSGGCSLNFATQPHDARTGQVITGTAYAPAGAPVSVEVLGTSGLRVTWSTAPITVALGSNPGASVLSGTSTVAASSGVAPFLLSLDQPGAGYTFVASSGGLTSTTSSGFSISQTATACAEDVDCTATLPLTQTNTAGGKSSVSVTAIQGPTTDVDAGFLTTSLNFGGQLDRSGYTELTSDIIVISYVGQSREKSVVETIDKKVMNATSNNGAAGLESCYGSPTRFATKPGTPLLTVNSAYVPGPYPAPEYKGLLPDCGKSAVNWDGTTVASAVPPCVVSRNKTGVGDAVIEARWPAAPTDPRSRS